MAIDPNKVSLTDVDPVSNMPYLHEAFILHTFVPLRYVRRQKPFDDHHFVGMYPEGFRIPTVLTKDEKGNIAKRTTFDDQVMCMMVGKETVGADNDFGRKCQCIAITEYTRPGFVTLTSQGPQRQAKSAPAFTREASSAVLKTHINERGTTSRSYLRKQNKVQLESEVEEVAETLTPRSFSANPSRKAKRQKLPDNVEYGLALKHLEWPEAAAEWKNRTRNVSWPGKRIEKKIVSLGCHVTPGAHPKSEDPDIEWMFTFFEAERILNKEAVSSVQRQCLIVFCLLCLDCLEKNMLSLQQIKSVFYYVCETLDTHLWRSNKAICVNKLLDHLLECIRCGNLPDYFVHKNNTLSHLDQTDLVKLESEVSKLRNNPAVVLLAMNDSCAFVNIFPFYCNVRDLFKPFVADAEVFSQKQEVEKSVRALLVVTDELCNCFYLDAGFETYENSYEEIGHYISSLIAHGVSGYEEAIEYFVKPLQGDKEAQKHLAFMPQLLSQKNITLSEKLPPTEIWRPVRMCRLLITKFANAKEGSHLYDHLGCMYHSASKVFKDQKKDALSKADEAFKEALDRQDCGIGTYADYGRFLCQTKRYEQSIPILRKVIMSEAKNPQSLNFYGQMESLVADDFIKREIKERNGFEVFSCSFSYYLLCESLIRMKKKADLFKTLNEFEEMCVHSNDPGSFTLLGYTLMKTHQFKKATSCFKKVEELRPDDKLVKENLAICDRHEGYNKTHKEVDLEAKMEKLNFWEI